MTKRITKTYEERTYDWMRPQLAELRKFTEQCRIDMHEPDEQGIVAHVVGDHLDNACNTRIESDAVERRYQEYVVILRNDQGDIYKINLACLLAIARLAVIPAP